ncbi:CBS domain-containing protein [Streptomyces tendae]
MTTHIVGEVMTRDVVHARRTTPFKAVVRLLDHHRIGGLPVIDADDKVLGVLSGSDLIRNQAHRDGPAPPPAVTAGDVTAGDVTAGDVTAGNLMSSPAITMHPEQTVPDAARLMQRRGVERLPVVDEADRLVGIATRRDLLRVFLRADDDIRRQVTEEIVVTAMRLPSDTVRVAARDGVVTLDGRVEARDQVPELVHAVWRLDGVVGVVNSLGFRIDDHERATPFRRRVEPGRGAGPPRCPSRPEPPHEHGGP